MNSFKPYFYGVGLGLILGMIVGYNLLDPTTIVVEKDAPAQVLPHGGYVLERQSDAVVPQPIKQAAKDLGGKLVRGGNVTVKPKQVDCPDVQLDWGLVKKDEGHRMVFYTDDGTITGGVDIPTESVEIRRYPKWSVGAIAPMSSLSGVGPYVQRHFGPVAVGAAAVKMPVEGWTGLVSVTVSW